MSNNKYFYLLKDKYSWDFNKGELLLDTKEKIAEALNKNLLDKFYRRVPAFKVGSLVRLTSNRPLGWCDNGDMDQFLDAEVYLENISYGNIEFDYEDSYEWTFRVTDIDEVIEY